MEMKYYEDFLKLEVFTLQEAREVVGSAENAKVLLLGRNQKSLTAFPIPPFRGLSLL